MIHLRASASVQVPGSCYLFILSANTAAELTAQSTNLALYLQQNEQVSLIDVAYTLQIACRKLKYRRILFGSDRTAIVKELEAGGSKGQTGCVLQPTPPVAFLFAGVGEQFVGMTQEFYQCESFFRSIIDRCCEILLPLLHVDLRNLLYPVSPPRLVSSAIGHRQEGRGLSRLSEVQPLQRTELAQPLMFMIEYALALLLMHWGIIPQALLGYSLGEYVAACVAGALSLEEALRLVTRRAIFIGQQPVGVMLAVLCSAQQVQPFLRNEAQVDLAVTNSPLQCVLAGPEEAIARVELRLWEAEIVSSRLRTGQAFHSSLLKGAREALQEEVKQILWQKATIPYLSNVTGTWIRQQEIEDEEYWGQHMCETARFAEGLEELITQGHRVLIEIGPGRSLGSLVKQWELVQQGKQLANEAVTMLSILGSAREKRDDHTILLEGIGHYWLVGGQVNWEAFWEEEAGQRIPLPLPSFEE